MYKLAWFAPFVENNSLLLEDFNGFITQEFQGSFGDTDSVRMTTNKIQSSRQGDCPSLTQATKFCLLAFDITWDEEELMHNYVMEYTIMWQIYFLLSMKI